MTIYKYCCSESCVDLILILSIYYLQLHLLKYKWDITKFTSRAPTHKDCKFSGGHWNDLATQRSFMDDLRHKFNITDWSVITGEMLKKYGASGLLHKYNYSPSKLLTTLYPEYRSSCRNTVLKIVQELKLNKVEDLLHSPLEYQKM